MAVHKSARGKKIDMEALRHANGDTAAVGNMSVNARGDKIDSQGNVIKTHAEVVAEYYAANGMNVPKESGIAESSDHALAGEAVQAGALEANVETNTNLANANLEDALKKSAALAEKIAAKRKKGGAEE